MLRKWRHRKEARTRFPITFISVLFSPMCLIFFFVLISRGVFLPFDLVKQKEDEEIYDEDEPEQTFIDVDYEDDDTI